MKLPKYYLKKIKTSRSISEFYVQVYL